MRAKVDINEAEIAEVSLGMPAVVVSDAYPQAHFDATLVKIYPEADRQKATVKVEVQIHRPDLTMIKPEMSVKANFLEKRATNEQQHRILVPAKAIVREGSESSAWVVRNGMTKRISVLRGSETENGVEVQQGLKDGDVLIVGPPANLNEDQRARALSGGDPVR